MLERHDEAWLLAFFGGRLPPGASGSAVGINVFCVPGGSLEWQMNEVRIYLEKLKILERLAAYTLTIDGKDPVGWANCFTEDGIFGQGDHAIRGRDNLRAYAEIHGSTLGSRHITSSPCYRIDQSGVVATGRSTTVVTIATPSGYKIAMTGLYEDELEKVDDDWLISRRWATVEGLPEDPGYSMLAADPQIAEMVQPLLDAWQRLSEEAARRPQASSRPLG